MYEYQRAVVKHRLPKVRFEEIDARALSLKTLLQQYAEVYLVLRHSALTGDHTLRLSDITVQLAAVTEAITVSQWLVNNGNTTLPVIKGQPQVKTQAVMARDAWQAGFKVDLCVPSGSPFNDATDYDKTDIWLTRPETNYVANQQHCLATVNGLVHRLDADKDGIYIKDGGITFRMQENATVGLMSFSNIGRVHTASITPEMVHNLDPSKLYSECFYLHSPIDLTNKVVGMVIGGYLHLATKDVTVVGTHSVKVDMRRIPFLERYMESRYQIDQSSMARFHEVSATNALDYDMQGFYSNECMLELLTLSQSFLVAIEVDHLMTEVVPATRTQLPGRFYFDERPLWPLRTQLGLLPSYLSEDENGVWVVRIDNNLRQHRFMDTRDSRWLPKVDEKRISGQPETYQRGEFLKWTHSTVTIV